MTRPTVTEISRATAHPHITTERSPAMQEWLSTPLPRMSKAQWAAAAMQATALAKTIERNPL